MQGLPRSSIFSPVLTCLVGLVLLGRGFLPEVSAPGPGTTVPEPLWELGHMGTTCPPFPLGSAFSFAFHSSFKVRSYGKLQLDSHKQPEHGEHPVHKYPFPLKGRATKQPWGENIQVIQVQHGHAFGNTVWELIDHPPPSKLRGLPAANAPNII